MNEYQSSRKHIAPKYTHSPANPQMAATSKNARPHAVLQNKIPTTSPHASLTMAVNRRHYMGLIIDSIKAISSSERLYFA